MKSNFKRIIEKWIPQNTKLLDLGCGDGDLLEHLKNSKNVNGFGIEIDISKLNVGEFIRVNQVEIEGVVSIISDPYDTIVRIAAPRTQAEVDGDADVEGEEGSEESTESESAESSAGESADS